MTRAQPGWATSFRIIRPLPNLLRTLLRPFSAFRQTASLIRPTLWRAPQRHTRQQQLVLPPEERYQVIEAISTKERGGSYG